MNDRLVSRNWPWLLLCMLMLSLGLALPVREGLKNESPVAAGEVAR